MESLNWSRLLHDNQASTAKRRDTPLTVVWIITGLTPALTNVNYAQQVELLVPPLWRNVNTFLSQVLLEQYANIKKLHCDLIQCRLVIDK